jgi:hypothetical protein
VTRRITIEAILDEATAAGCAFAGPTSQARQIIASHRRIADNEAEAIRAIGQLDLLDRRRVREQFEHRFTSLRMAQDSVSLFEKIACGAAQQLIRR